ncbi:MFS transporter [Thermogemmatispora carboxidivorans]|uniref:MFS transporter n=1 Tax=Thermogemmatispora carboxidivorans TaxID=1382306 RepID=UPI000699E9A6|nr:MFS transporter [Thermogemmatispora carboxidivorans]
MSLLVDYLRQFTRLQRNARLYLISNALGGVSLGILLLLYNLYLDALGYRADFIGAVQFAATVGAGLAIFPAGLCVDRLGGKTILIVASLLIGLLGAGQILFRQALPLLVTAFLAGVVSAALLVVNAPYLTQNSLPAERSHLFSLNLVVTLVTSVAGRLLGGALPVWFRQLTWFMGPLPFPLNALLAPQAEARAYQLALIAAGLLAIPSLIPLFLLDPDPRPLSKPAADGRLRSLLTGGVGGLVRRRVWASWRRRLDWKVWRRWLGSALVLLTLEQGLIGFGAGLFIPYFNLFFVRHLGASSWQFGLIDGGATALTAGATLLAPWLAARLGKARAVVATQALSLPLMLVLGFSPSLLLAALLYPLRQGVMDMTMGVLQAFSMEVVPAQWRGLANSSYQAAYWIAYSVSTPLGGIVIVQQGYAAIFVLAAISYALAILVLWQGFGRDPQEKTRGEAGMKPSERGAAEAEAGLH